MMRLKERLPGKEYKGIRRGIKRVVRSFNKRMTTKDSNAVSSTAPSGYIILFRVIVTRAISL